jgi:nucleoside-diphosphate-sugar epimerase
VGVALKYLVTGCAGFIGSHLVERLCALGHTVVGVDILLPLLYSRAEKERNLSEISQYPNFHFLELDLRHNIDPKILDGIDTIFNLAAMPGLTPSWTSMKDYFDCNSLIVGNICAASKEVGGVPIIQASTSSVYGLSATGSESDFLKPISPYGVSKLAAEQLLSAFANAFGIPFTILRYFSVYGPRQRPDMAYRKIIDKILNQSPIEIHGDGKQTRSNTYVSDIVDATIKSSQKGFVGETFNIGGAESIQILEAVNIIQEFLGLNVEINFMPPKLGDQQQTLAKYNKAEKDLAYRPITRFLDGITHQIQWQRSHPILT